MNCCTCLMLPVLALAVVMGYYLNMTIPDAVEQPMVARLAMASARMTTHASAVYSTLTGEDEVVVNKRLVSFCQNFATGSPEDGVSVTDETISGVPVRIYKPEEAGSGRRAILYLHGPSFHHGSIEANTALCSQLALMNDAVVFNIDYRKAPDHPSPAALTDAHKVALAVLKGGKWGIDNKKIAVFGDGGGGGLAAALALKLRDTNARPPLAAQVLIYPLLQALDFHTPSREMEEQYPGFSIPTHDIAAGILIYLNGSQDFIDHLLDNTHISALSFAKHKKLVDHKLLPKSMIPAGFKHHKSTPPKAPLSAKFEKGVLNPYNFPLMVTDTSKLPPAFILTVEGDTLADDGAIYGRRLQDGGSHVTHVHEGRGFFGMMGLLQGPFQSNVAMEMLEQIKVFLAKHL